MTFSFFRELDSKSLSMFNDKFISFIFNKRTRAQKITYSLPVKGKLKVEFPGQIKPPRFGAKDSKIS